jgi:hypothetical protein
VIYDAGGFERDADDANSSYDVRGGRAALVCENEEESVDDPGANAVASINVRG